MAYLQRKYEGFAIVVSSPVSGTYIAAVETELEEAEQLARHLAEEDRVNTFVVPVQSAFIWEHGR